MDDIWKEIDYLMQEAYEATNSYKGSLKSVFQQLPFFCCVNKFLDDKYQKDVEKYVYCEDTKTPPYKGSYGDIPQIWKQKHFIIKQSLSILQEIKMDKLKQNKKK